MPRCRSDLMVRNGSYRVYQPYLGNNCGRTFNDRTWTIFAHTMLTLKEWYFSVYVQLRYNTSLRQIEEKLDLSFKTVIRRVERVARALDAPQYSFWTWSKSTECTFLPVSKAASATPSYARVVCPYVDEDCTPASSRQCSRWTTAARMSATSCQRNPLMNLTVDSCCRPRTGAVNRLYRRMSGLRPTKGRRGVRPRTRRPQR